MITIKGYHTTQKIYESGNSLIYQGYQEHDNAPVIFKTLNHAYPTPEQIAWFKREYEVTHTLNLAGVIKVYALENVEQQWVMVLEDFGGQSLKQLNLTKGLALPEFLPLALKITEILGQVHQQQIMHKDINPANIVLNPDTNVVKLIDFGISTVLSRENPTFRNPNVLEGTLAYISPEQTGRMNRAMDYRTDFYSLGVTFYELLTGQLPFSATDPLEMIHAHIAKQVPLLYKVKPDIPQTVSAIVLKLLAKDAEDRYQSSLGLQTDLERCLSEWQETGQITPFPLGQADVSERFQLPQKLYGREPEIAMLLAAFERVSNPAGEQTSRGAGEQGSKQAREQGSRGAEEQGNQEDLLEKDNPKSELMLVGGYAGIGKSMLVQEIYKPITQRRGYFIGGKFDQFQKDIPYSALVQAFRTLIQHILTEDETQIARWRKKLLTALGNNGQVIIEVIPELELIINSQGAVPDLPPAESQNRFNLVFQNFIKAFAQAEHPLVLFLDDLQWADGASLQMLDLLLNASDSQHLFIIGAYRDNEVDDAHPLMLQLHKIEQAGAVLNHITVPPLNLTHISQFIADTLNDTTEAVTPLAKLVLDKTNGNPFFINEFLKSLYAENLIWFGSIDNSDTDDTDDINTTKRGWQWDLAQIQAQDISTNVVELVTSKIQKLDKETQSVLQLAACIGNQFNLQTLAVVHKKQPKQTATALWPAIMAGLILPLDDAYKLMQLETHSLSQSITATYKFAHDRVQQAVYGLIPQADKQKIHWEIGNLLLENTPPAQREEKIFDLVNHLNQGYSLLKEQTKRDELAQLNLIAGKKAKLSAAYEPAFNYLDSGIKLLGENAWQRNYDLSLSLHIDVIEAAYLKGDFEEMARLADIALQESKTLLDKVKIHEIRILSYIAENNMAKAVDVCREVLKPLGITLPQKANMGHLIINILQTKLALGRRQVKDLKNLAPITDPLILAAMGIMKNAAASAYIATPDLYPIMLLKMTYLSLKYGHSRYSCFSYVNYALILAGPLNDIETGERFGKLALEMLDAPNTKDLKAKIYTVYYYGVAHWSTHIKNTQAPLLEGYQAGLETGDLEFAAICALVYSQNMIFLGVNLKSIEAECIKYGNSIKKLNQIRHFYAIEYSKQFALNLTKQTDDVFTITGVHDTEEAMIAYMKKTNDEAGLFFVYILKCFLYYLFERYAEALKYSNMAEKDLPKVTGSNGISLFHLYDSLIHLALYPSVSPLEQKQYLKKVKKNQKRLKLWMKHAPENNKHRFYIVEAEKMRILGKDKVAREYYDQAISLARESEYTREEAIANELAAKFYLGRKQIRLAHHYLREAHYTYTRWGAIAKIEHLETLYPNAFTQTEYKHTNSTTMITSTITRRTTTQHHTFKTLDLTSVIKASQTISSEIVQDKLLSKLMKIVIENAGAQLGYLLLREETKIEATAASIASKKENRWVVQAVGNIEQDEITILQTPTATKDTVNLDIALPETIINYVTRTKKSIVLDDAAHQGQFTHDPYIVAAQPKSLLCAPLLNHGQLTAILYLENNLSSQAFTPERLEILNLLSSQAAVSIENALLYTNSQTNEEKYRTLFEDSKDAIFVTTANGQVLDLNPAGLDLFGYTPTDIHQTNVLDVYVNPEDRHEFLKIMQKEGLVKDFETKLRKRNGTEIDCLVTATVRHSKDGSTFTYQGIIRNISAQKQAEQERLKLTAIERELSIAHEIQQSLLPPPKPNWPNLEVVCFTIPARDVGGDFYSYHTFSTTKGQKYALAVGDVSGKGISAALLMATSLSQFDASQALNVSPAERMTHLDKKISPYTESRYQNCAMCYVEIVLSQNTSALQKGHLEIVNAGCIPPFIKHANGEVAHIMAEGMPLGVGLGAELGYKSVTIPLSEGDIIVLSSDGLVEANNPAVEMLGFDTLEAIIKAAPTTSAETMLNHLREAVLAFTDGAEQHDDMTIVVIRVL